MKRLFILLTVFSLSALLVSCGSGGLSGTYVPSNCNAINFPIAKLVFNENKEVSGELKIDGNPFTISGKGNIVKIYMGVMGVAMPGALECRYSLEGNKLLIEGGIPGVNGGSLEFTYNRDSDKIMLMDGTMGELAPTWCNEQKAPKDPCADKNKENPVIGAPTNGNTQVPNQKSEKDSSSPASTKMEEFIENAKETGKKIGNVVKNLFGPSTKDPCNDGYFDYEKQQISFNKEVAETCALYSVLAYDETRIPNSVSLSSRETLREYAIRQLSGNSVDFYIGERNEFSNNYEPWLLQARLEVDGYGSIISRNYHDDDEHNISYTLAHKKFGDNETQLVVVLRGTDYVEWRGNMHMRKEDEPLIPLERHYSFEQANRSLQKAIKQYVTDNQLKNIHFLLTGHSRGAAVANLLAVDLNRGVDFKICSTKEVYAYTFATPNNSTQFSLEGNENIYNFCFKDDFVPQVPLSEWGYGKSGKTVYAVAQTLYGSGFVGPLLPDESPSGINGAFATKVNEYIRRSYSGRSPSFDYAATQKVLKDIKAKAPTVDVYYTDKIKMAPLREWSGYLIKILLTFNYPKLAAKVDPEEDKTLYEFMRDYLAGAMIALDEKDYFNSATVGTVTKILPAGNDISEIAVFFVGGGLISHYFNDTHQALTYYHALTSGGFGDLTSD